MVVFLCCLSAIVCSVVVCGAALVQMGRAYGRLEMEEKYFIYFGIKPGSVEYMESIGGREKGGSCCGSDNQTKNSGPSAA